MAAPLGQLPPSFSSRPLLIDTVLLQISPSSSFSLERSEQDTGTVTVSEHLTRVLHALDTERKFEHIHYKSRNQW